jgi:hypothetical protein
LNDATDHSEGALPVSIIINARFQQQSEADSAVFALNSAGFESRFIATFYVSSPGQHAMHPLGGDEEESPGTVDAPSTAAAGAAVGTVAGAITGAATLPVLGPAAAAAAVGVGAWVGSLYGALGGTDSKAVEEQRVDTPDPASDERARKSGMLVAVAVKTGKQERDAISLLQHRGGMDVKRCTGIISNGEWRDFDPLNPIHPVDAEYHSQHELAEGSTAAAMQSKPS